MNTEQVTSEIKQPVDRPIQGIRRLKDNPVALQEAARALLAGDRPRDVLRNAGYTETQAKKGKLPQILLRAIAANSKKFEAIGADLKPEQVANLVKGRLAYNTVTGESKGIDAAKALGSMKEYQLFQPDSLTGVIVLQQPTIALAGKTVVAADTRDLED